jgi:signal transduction histidine kinase
MNLEGCGLGLTVAKTIAKALGGDLNVESIKN